MGAHSSVEVALGWVVEEADAMDGPVGAVCVVDIALPAPFMLGVLEPENAIGVESEVGPEKIADAEVEDSGGAAVAGGAVGWGAEGGGGGGGGVGGGEGHRMIVAETPEYKTPKRQNAKTPKRHAFRSASYTTVYKY